MNEKNTNRIEGESQLETEACDCDGPEFPTYRCHKEVHALKIKSIEFDAEIAHKENRETTGTAKFTPEDGRFGEVLLSAEYIHKHKPEAGGYYVVYEDGYKSFSPAKAFEEGYTII